MVLNIVFMVLSLAVGLSFIFLLITSGEFEEYITPLDKKDFMLSEIYGVGYKIIKITNMEFKSREANKVRENVVVLYGERYAEFYVRAYYAQKISIIYLVAALLISVISKYRGIDSKSKEINYFLIGNNI